MPYQSPAQERFIHARAHGWKPSDPKLAHLSVSKAKELETDFDAAEAKKKARSAGQRAAIAAS